MSIPVIDTLHALGNFPVANSSEVQCGELRLDAVLNASAAELALKANKNYVDTNFALKSNSYSKPSGGIPKTDLSSAVQSSLNKADTALQSHQDLSAYAKKTDLPVIPTNVSAFTNDSGYLTSHQDISGKADKTYVDLQLATKANSSEVQLKADSSTVSTLSGRVTAVEAEQTVLSARMDTFTTLDEGSTTGDAELADGRVAVDGTTYENIGGAIRGQITDLMDAADRSNVSYETFSGSYIGIDSNGAPVVRDSSGGPFRTSSVIQLSKGDVVEFTAAGYNNSVSMITRCSDSGETLYSVLERSRSSNVETYAYTAKSDIYIKLSYNYNKNNKLVINGKKSNKSIFDRLDTSAIVYEDNILSSSFDLNNCIPNRIYILSVSCVNAPDGVSAAVVYSVAKSSSSTNTYPQILITYSNEVYVRFNRYNSGWTEWKAQLTTDSPVLMSSGTNIRSSTFDLNDCALNRIYIVSTSCVNSPEGCDGGILYSVAKSNTSNDTYAQFMVNAANGKLYTRFKKYGGTWTNWSSSNTNDDYKSEYEKSHIKLSLFSTVGVIGDSYASGEIYSTNGTLIGDIYRISWIQQLARRNGFTAYNFSKGGLTTRSWLTSEHGLSLLNSTDACKLYILALGINDYYNLGESYLGTTGDMDTEADTFYGNYAKIIRAVKSKNSNAKIMISKCGIRSDASSSSKTLIEKFNVAIENLADKFEIAVIDLTENHYISSSKFANMLINGHPSAVGYSAYATAYEEAISVSMFRNSSYFETADFT